MSGGPIQSPEMGRDETRGVRAGVKENGSSASCAPGFVKGQDLEGEEFGISRAMGLPLQGVERMVGPFRGPVERGSLRGFLKHCGTRPVHAKIIHWE
jgi:hypothetical protein